MLFLDRTPDLTAIEWDIYHYIAKQPKQVTYMRIRELANEIHVSPTSILRFCQKFDCDGFTEFKIRLNLFLKAGKQLPPTEKFDPYGIEHFIQRTREKSFDEVIHQAAQLIVDSDLVLFSGKGVSSVVAHYGALHFSSAAIMALRIEDAENYPFERLNQQLASRTTVIICSVGGENESMLTFANHMLMKQCPIIAITNSLSSRLARLSSVAIPYYINKNQVYDADITSQVPAIYILELLANTVNQLR